MMRNSTRPDSGYIYFTSEEFSTFLLAAKAGEFDLAPVADLSLIGIRIPLGYPDGIRAPPFLNVRSFSSRGG